jgi:uncharacterized membrane protein
MNGSLIVITFDRADRAEKVFDALHAMRRRAIYSLDEALVVTRSRNGQVHPHHSQTLANTQRAHTLGVILGLIFDEEGNERGSQTDIKAELVACGFDLHFLEIIGREMQDESSAIFFLVRRTSVGDADEIIKVLSLFHGHVSRTTVSPESEAYLSQLAS